MSQSSRIVAFAALAAGCTSVSAAPCGELRQAIEARIRANGVVSFTVTPVDAAASAPGQVVGTCDQGRKKLLYVRGAATAGSSSSDPGIVTECKDGRVLEKGSCR